MTKKSDSEPGAGDPPSLDWEVQLLAAERAVAEGNNSAVAHGVFVCHVLQKPLPDWLFSAVLKLLPNADNMARSKLNRRRQDMIDMTRYTRVIGARERGIGWVDVFNEVSRELHGTWSAAGPDAIERSYKNFKRRFKTQSGRYLPSLIDFISWRDK